MILGELIKQKNPNEIQMQFWRGNHKLKSIPGDYLMKLVKIMPKVFKAVIKINSSYFEESKIWYIQLFYLHNSIYVILHF